ncbi:MAG: hypothetical protein R3F21_24255 [Myxococcota bacterium]
MNDSIPHDSIGSLPDPAQGLPGFDLLVGAVAGVRRSRETQ